MIPQPTPQHEALFSDWLFITEQALDGLAVWKSWLLAWQDHELLGHLDPALFDAVLADLERRGLGQVINDKNTRSLRRAVTGQELKL